MSLNWTQPCPQFSEWGNKLRPVCLPKPPTDVYKQTSTGSFSFCIGRSIATIWQIPSNLCRYTNQPAIPDDIIDQTSKNSQLVCLHAAASQGCNLGWELHRMRFFGLWVVLAHQHWQAVDTLWLRIGKCDWYWICLGFALDLHTEAGMESVISDRSSNWWKLLCSGSS